MQQGSLVQVLLFPHDLAQSRLDLLTDESKIDCPTRAPHKGAGTQVSQDRL
jgi:hypothetical protein